MSIEKLTDDERLNIGCMSGRDGEFARKALRIIDQLTEALEAAESERYTYATALANADDSKSRVRELEASIAAANVLLERACPQSHNEAHIRKWWADREAHLSVQPASPTDHDRAILEAVETVEEASLRYYSDTFGTETGWGAVSGAELARREAKR